MKSVNVYRKGIKVGETKVSDEDFSSVDSRIWYLNKDGYAQRHTVVDGKKRVIYLHRQIMNPPSDMFVDHINGDRLDNRRNNLRVATQAHNNKNQGIRVKSCYRMKGVRRRGNVWQADIRSDGICYYLGQHRTAYLAAAAYNEAAQRLHGEYARLNDLRAIASHPDLNRSVPRHQAVRSSPYPGVYWNTRANMWMVARHTPISQVYLGYYNEDLDAISAAMTLEACL